MTRRRRLGFDDENERWRHGRRRVDEDDV